MLDMSELSISGLLNRARNSTNPCAGAIDAWHAFNRSEAEGFPSENAARKHLDLLLPDLIKIEPSPEDPAAALNYTRTRFNAEQTNDYVSLFQDAIRPILVKGQNLTTPEEIKAYLEKEATKMEATCRENGACKKSGSCKTPKGLKAIRDTLAALPLLSDTSETIWDPEAVWNHLKNAGSNRAKNKKEMRQVIGEFLQETPEDAPLSAQEIQKALLTRYVKRQTEIYKKNRKMAFDLTMTRLAEIPTWNEKENYVSKNADEIFSFLSDIYLEASRHENNAVKQEIYKAAQGCLGKLEKNAPLKEIFACYWAQKPEHEIALRAQEAARKQASPSWGRSFFRYLFKKQKNALPSPQT